MSPVGHFLMSLDMEEKITLLPKDILEILQSCILVPKIGSRTHLFQKV